MHPFYKQLYQKFGVSAKEHLPKGALTKAYRDLYDSQMEFPPVEECGFLLIDQQRRYCDPDYSGRGNTRTRAVARRSAEVFKGFDSLGMRSYFVYFDDQGEGYSQAKGGGYLVTPTARTSLIQKWDDDVVGHSAPKIEAELGAHNNKLIFAAGFNAGACFSASVMSLKKAGFDVCVLLDCVGQDSGAYMFETQKKNAALAMHNKGLKFAHSSNVLARYEQSVQQTLSCIHS